MSIEVTKYMEGFKEYVHIRKGNRFAKISNRYYKLLKSNEDGSCSREGFRTDEEVWNILENEDMIQNFR